MTKGKNPMKNLHGRLEFTHAETYDAPEDAQSGNPWDRLTGQDDSWRVRPWRHISLDLATVGVLLFVAGVVIGIVLAMRA